MALSGIHSYHQLPVYNAGASQPVPRTERPAESEKVNLQNTDTGSLPEKQAENEQLAPKTADLAQFTFDFKKNPFHLVAATNDIEDIDVEKALSDMKKDGVLDQYKYFVNPVNMGTDGDGTVRIKNSSKY